MNKILAHFGDALCKKFIFFIALGVQFDNEVHPPPKYVLVKGLRDIGAKGVFVSLPFRTQNSMCIKQCMLLECVHDFS